jgi:CheY-like chemotaxis protein
MIAGAAPLRSSPQPLRSRGSETLHHELGHEVQRTGDTMTEPDPLRTSADAPALIVVVEDEDAIRRLVQDTLEGEGYAVLPARSAEDAIAMLEDGAIKPSLILLDLRLPGMDGFGFITAYRGSRQGQDTAPIILVSALRMRDELPEGVSAYLRKPFDLDDLLANVKRTIAAE